LGPDGRVWSPENVTKWMSRQNATGRGIDDLLLDPEMPDLFRRFSLALTEGNIRYRHDQPIDLSAITWRRGRSPPSPVQLQEDEGWFKDISVYGWHVCTFAIDLQEENTSQGRWQRWEASVVVEETNPGYGRNMATDKDFRWTYREVSANGYWSGLREVNQDPVRIPAGEGHGPARRFEFLFLNTPVGDLGTAYVQFKIQRV
jgi:hypothetical protein